MRSYYRVLKLEALALLLGVGMAALCPSLLAAEAEAGATAQSEPDQKVLEKTEVVAPVEKAASKENSKTETTPVATEQKSVPSQALEPENPEMPEGEGRIHTTEAKLYTGPTTASNLLSVAARFDTSYSAGGAVYQGFAIPSARLSVFGTAMKQVDYRFSLGQTREFATASLPQMLPVEAYINALTNAPEDKDSVQLRFKVGMFTPLMHPNWTPDLSDIDLPDYNETHRALFLSRDIGAELLFQPIPERLELGVGVFNGGGIFSLNTNNGKALNAYVKLTVPAGDFKIAVGSGNYTFNQSVAGNVNYKASYASDVFLSLESMALKTELIIDGFYSHFEDSTRTLSPTGGSGVLHIGIKPWLKLFGRIESANASPLLNGAIRHYQFGPEFIFSEAFKAFFTYQQLESGGSVEKIMLIRLRLMV